MKSRVAIIAALPREVAPLIKGWKDESDRARKVFVFTTHHSVVAYAGMGALRAEIAARHVLDHGPISHLLSVGWAGALREGCGVGSLQHPAEVIDAVTGESFPAVAGTGRLVTVTKFAGVEEKQKLATDFDADYVDMEAATIARIAVERAIPFAAVKTISDERDTVLPELQRFYTSDGWFQEKRFALHVAVRPWLWSSVIQTGKNASMSAQKLCEELQRILQAYEAMKRQEEQER